METTLSLTAVYEPVENGCVQARIEEIPGVITAAPTRAEAEELLGDALRDYLLATWPPVTPATTRGERTPLRVVIGAA